MTQLESSKPGAASGVSSACFHVVSAGSEIAWAVAIVPTCPPVGSAPPVNVTGAPFQVTFVASLNTSIEPLSALSPVSASVSPVWCRAAQEVRAADDHVALLPEVARGGLVGDQEQQRRRPPPIAIRISPLCL